MEILSKTVFFISGFMLTKLPPKIEFFKLYHHRKPDLLESQNELFVDEGAAQI